MGEVRTGKRIASDLADGLYEQILALSPLQLAALRRRLAGLSMTNCSWVVHALRHGIDQLAKQAQESKSYDRFVAERAATQETTL